MSLAKCYLNALGMLCSVGDSAAAVKRRLVEQRTGMTISNDFGLAQPLPLGLYQGELPAIPLVENKWQSRNNQFALVALRQIEAEVENAIKRHGAGRVGVIVGTSTSGIAESEPAIRRWVQEGVVPDDYDYGIQEMGATADFVATVLGVQGPVYGISTACSSGAKALASARRLIQAGICDAVIAGGVDTICRLTVQGFSSLEAVSDERCNPFSQNRKGINIGEGAALFLVTAEANGVELLGVGESSDAHHISAPEPSGSGAKACMNAALQDAGIAASDVDYVNLHGTATALNDQMESLAMAEVFGSQTCCSSTKPFTGHTLGAAGAVEAAICWLTLHQDATDGWLPVQIWDGKQDSELAVINLVDAKAQLDQPLNYALSNSFAFGGNNISLLLGRIA